MATADGSQINFKTRKTVELGAHGAYGHNASVLRFTCLSLRSISWTAAPSPARWSKNRKALEKLTDQIQDALR